MKRSVGQARTVLIKLYPEPFENNTCCDGIHLTDVTMTTPTPLPTVDEDRRFEFEALGKYDAATNSGSKAMLWSAVARKRDATNVVLLHNASTLHMCIGQ